MWLRPFSTFLPSLVLLTVLSCSRKTEPIPTTDTGSYEIAGQRKACSVTASTSATPSGQTTITLLLTTVPQPASGPEVLNIEFTKAAGQPTSAYQVSFIAIGSSGRIVTIFSTLTATLTSTGNSISGTFAASGTATNPTSDGGVTDGVITNVQL